MPTFSLRSFVPARSGLKEVRPATHDDEDEDEDEDGGDDDDDDDDDEYGSYPV